MDAVSGFFEDFAAFKTGAAWVSLGTLTLLELVLGIDNIVFLSILTGRLPADRQPKIRRTGLLLALLMRLGLLFAISWVMGMTTPVLTIPLIDHPLSGRDLILLGGGLFLMYKATSEIFASIEAEGEHEADLKKKQATRVGLVLLQIVAIDLVFSLDSIITAVGMAQHVSVMVVAMILAVLGMMLFAEPLARFVSNHPSIKVLALAFLLLIGVLLVADAFDKHIPRGYLYFAMGFALAVELINMRARKKRSAKARAGEKG